MKALNELISAAKVKDHETAKKACLEIRESILGMTPTKFAAELHVSRQTVHAWEKTGEIPLRRAEEIKKLVEAQGVRPQAARRQAESLTADQVLERITRCKKVWIIKGATAFQGGLFEVVEKKLETCLSLNPHLTINYVFPNFPDGRYKKLLNTPLRSYLRFKGEIVDATIISRVGAYPVTKFEDAFLLCISASPAGLIILEYDDAHADGPSRELVVELWDRDEHDILRKLSDLYASQIYEGMAPTLERLKNDSEIEKLIEDKDLLRIPPAYSYPI